MDLASVVVLNKADLNPQGAQELKALYASIPYPTITASTVQPQGLEELREVLQGKVSVLAGPSGVGKSSLLNALSPELKLQTGQVSEKIQRGRHTTRSVELLPFGQGYVADTQGFPALSGTRPGGHTTVCLPRIRSLSRCCQFRGCLHRQEPAARTKGPGDGQDSGQPLRALFDLVSRSITMLLERGLHSE